MAENQLIRASLMTTKTATLFLWMHPTRHSQAGLLWFNNKDYLYISGAFFQLKALGDAFIVRGIFQPGCSELDGFHDFLVAQLLADNIPDGFSQLAVVHARPCARHVLVAGLAVSNLQSCKNSRRDTPMLLSLVSWLLSCITAINELLDLCRRGLIALVAG